MQRRLRARQVARPRRRRLDRHLALDPLARVAHGARHHLHGPLPG